jgi:thioredoxin-related protein
MKAITLLLTILLLILTVLVLSERQEGAERDKERARREQAFKDRIANLKREKENIARLGNAYRDTLEHIRVKYSEQLTRKASTISNIKKRVEILKADTTKHITVCGNLRDIVSAQDTVIAEQEGMIVILQEEKGATWNSFNKILDNDKAMIDTLQAEVDAYKTAYEVTESDLAAERKQKKKARRQRNLAVVLGVAAIIFVGSR